MGRRTGRRTLPALCPGCNAPSRKAGRRAGWAPPPGAEDSGGHGGARSRAAAIRATSRARTGSRPSAALRRPRPPPPESLPQVQAWPVPRTVQASQYRDVDEGLAGDGGPDGGRVLIAHDGCVLTGPVRHEVVDVGVPPGHGAAIGAALGAAAGAAGWARAGGRGKTKSLGHALPSGPRLC